MQEILENIVSQKSFEALLEAKQLAERTEELVKILGVDPNELDLLALETLNDIREGQNFRTNLKVSSPRTAAQKEIKKILP